MLEDSNDSPDWLLDDELTLLEDTELDETLLELAELDCELLLDELDELEEDDELDELLSDDWLVPDRLLGELALLTELTDDEL